MRAIDKFFQEVLRHRVMAAHATLFREAREEYARLQALEEAARKAKDALSEYYLPKNNGGINYAYNILNHALSGEK